MPSEINCICLRAEEGRTEKGFWPISRNRIANEYKICMFFGGARIRIHRFRIVRFS